MLLVHVQAPYASFRKSYARSYAETYPVAPPATVYGMLLSLVGEWKRAAHAGVRLAFAYAAKANSPSPLPKTATVLRKLTRFKYGVAAKQAVAGSAPDYVETLCGLSFLCWIDSDDEHGTCAQMGAPRLEARVHEAISTPERITRSGVVCLGMSDDAIDDVSVVEEPKGAWCQLIPTPTGTIELPVWVDHVGSIDSRWQRFDLRLPATVGRLSLAASDFVPIVDPRRSSRAPQ